MINIAICDNNINETSLIEELIIKIEETYLISISISVYYNPSYLLNKALSNNYFDMIYLSIPSITEKWLHEACTIRTIAPYSKIILISSYDILASDIIDIKPSGFMKTPLSQLQFIECFFKLYNQILTNKTYFEYKFNKILHKIPLAKIMYFESRGRKIIIVTTDECYHFNGKLNSIENNLQSVPDSFIRIHQSFLVNTCYISKIYVSKLLLTNGIVLHISPDKQKYLLENYKNIFQFEPYSSYNFRII